MLHPLRSHRWKHRLREFALHALDRRPEMPLVDFDSDGAASAAILAALRYVLRFFAASIASSRVMRSGFW